MTRYSDRDAYTALIMVAARTGLAIVLPSRERPWSKDLRRLAADLNVPVAIYLSDQYDRLMIDWPDAIYGGGCRPMLLLAGETGHDTPAWWPVSAGLGPGAVPRKVFCWICRAVSEALYDRAEREAPRP